VKALTTSEAMEWCRAHGIGLSERNLPARAESDLRSRRFATPSVASKHYWFSRFIEGSLGPWSRCLLWVTASGIWKNSENWHLYYRLRQSYGDRGLIEEAPAHLFLDYESGDLISFLQVGLGMGWDMHLLTSDDYARVFVCHDEWTEFAVTGDAELERLTTELTKAGVKALSSANSATADEPLEK
jgi:hypothetical protein